MQTFTSLIGIVAVIVIWSQSKLLFLFVKVEIVVYTFILVKIFFLNSQKKKKNF